MNRDPMTDPETKGRGGCLTVAILVAVLLLPIAYVLSIGPALWLSLNYYIPPKLYQIYASPVFFVAYKCQPLDDALNWYLSIFNV